jgi:hypothetical protein
MREERCISLRKKENNGRLPKPTQMPGSHKFGPAFDPAFGPGFGRPNGNACLPKLIRKNMLLLALLMFSHQEDHERLKLLYIYLSMYRARLTLRTRNTVLSSSLVQPCANFWTQLWNTGSDAELIAAVGFKRQTIIELSRRASEHYIILSGIINVSTISIIVFRLGRGKGGRPRRLPNITQAVALLLVFYRDRMNYTSLGLMFGLPAATLSRNLNDMEAAMFKVLRGYRDAQIRWPTLAEQRHWAGLINAKEPLITNK